MIIDEIKDKARIITHITRWHRGYLYYKESKAYGVSFLPEEDNLAIYGQVEGSKSYRDYECLLILNMETLNIDKTRCTCEDFRENSRHDSYMCKHLVAILLESMDMMENTNRVEALLSMHEEVYKAAHKSP